MANSVKIDGAWLQPGSTTNAAAYLQGGSRGVKLQGSSPTLQTTGNPQKAGGSNLQVTANPFNYVDPHNTGVLGLSTTAAVNSGGAYDPAAAAAAAKTAADAAKASKLRGEVTNLVNSIKNIFNQRYGQAETSAKEQVGKLNDRFKNESGDLTNQIASENEKLGAAHASSGTYDSSYRGNNVDTITRAGESQIRDLGTELQDNVAKIAQWAEQQKTGINANKSGMDTILRHLAETTDPNELLSLRNQLDSRITDLKAGGADNNTESQNIASLNKIAPSSARGTQLKTTLSQVVAGNAPSAQKLAIGQKLIASAGLTPEEQQALLSGFTGDIKKQDQQQA